MSPHLALNSACCPLSAPAPAAASPLSLRSMFSLEYGLLCMAMAFSVHLRCSRSAIEPKEIKEQEGQCQIERKKWQWRGFVNTDRVSLLLPPFLFSL